MTIYTNPALQPVAGNQYVPVSMEARGKIRPAPPTSGVRNGVGELVVSGLWAYDWSYSYMTKSEMAWWKNLIGYSVASGIYSARFVTQVGLPAARLWVQDGSIVDFRQAVIDMPSWASYRNGLFLDVNVHYSFMLQA